MRLRATCLPGHDRYKLEPDRAVNTMFSISLTNDPLEYPYDDESISAAPGMLIFGESQEEFLANLALWGKSDYESHWRHELKTLIEGASKIALVVSYNDPRAASNLEIWRAYRDGDWVHFQNQFVWYSSLPKGFDVSQMSSYVDDRVTTTADGDRISEWDVALRDIEVFLQNTAAV